MSSCKEQPDSACAGPGERAVEGLLAAVGSTVGKVAEHIPGTAEHELRKTLDEEGDLSVDTGERLPRDAGDVRQVAEPPSTGVSASD